MNNYQPNNEDVEKPLDPAQARLIAKVRWLMVLSGFATILGIAVVLGIIGYRVFSAEERPAEVTAMLPKGAKVVSTAAADNRIVVTIELDGAVEVRIFDIKSLRLLSRMRFANEP
jgi:hypothetical protein